MLDMGILQDDVIKAGAAIAASGTIVLAVRKMYGVLDKKVLEPARSTIEKIDKNYGNMSEAMPILIAMSKEFTPNCGSSLRDCINRIENNIDNLRATDHLLLEMSDIGHFETDGNGECIWANKKYEALTGLDLHELLGRGWINAIHPEDRDKVIKEWFDAVADKRPFLYIFRYIKRSGEVVNVRVQAVINFNNKGVCIGALGSVFETN